MVDDVVTIAGLLMVFGGLWGINPNAALVVVGGLFVLGGTFAAMRKRS
jgi:hypothetical protein